MRNKDIKKVNIQDIEKDILPCFIYNRYDLWVGPCDYIILKVNDSYTVEVLFKEDIATIGSIMLDINQKDFVTISKYIFTIRKDIKKVVLNDTRCKIRPASTHNYSIVQLYKDETESDARITSKHRSEYKKSIKKLTVEYGEMKFVEYLASDIPSEIFDFYFSQKYHQLNAQYNMSNEEYISSFHVTHAYVLYFGDYVGYVAFSCEQTPIVFLENHVYDLNQKTHSLGTIGLLMYFKALGKKGFDYLYLGHCDYAYKKRFSNHTTIVYTSVFYRSRIKRVLTIFSYTLRRIQSLF